MSTVHQRLLPPSRRSNVDRIPVAPLTSWVALLMVVDAPISSHQFICLTNYTVLTAAPLRLQMKLKMMNDALDKVRAWVAPLRQTIWSLSLSQLPPSSTQKSIKRHWGYPPLRQDNMQRRKHTQTHFERETCQFVALYLQASASLWHIADHDSFETESSTRTLNSWLLKYIPYVLDNGHKNCLEL